MSVFESWRTEHPNWRVISEADEFGYPIIEVPQVQIGSLTVGPVWFASRGDQNFSTFMSQWTDAPVVGALGGSAFRYFDVVLDYPAEQACFAPPAPVTGTRS